MQTKVVLNHSRHNLGGVNKIIAVVVTNGIVSATYQATVLLGGGVKSCVDTQAEYDANATAAALSQFKLDCALAAGLKLFEVDAGRLYTENGELYSDSKYCDAFVSMEDAVAAIESNWLHQHDYCTITHAGKICGYQRAK